MNRSNEQKLIDIMFSIAQYSAENWSSPDYYGEHQEKHMEWVAQQLRACGFDTKPVGSTWGVLQNSKG